MLSEHNPDTPALQTLIIDLSGKIDRELAATVVYPIPYFRGFRLSGGISMVRLVMILLLAVIPVFAQYGVKDGQWRFYGGDLGSTRYSSLDQINADNVKDLAVAWTWKSDNFGTREFKSETTPIMVNGVLYFTAGDRRSVVAIDAEN